MIFLFKFPGARELAALLRRRGLYTIVRDRMEECELSALYASVLTPAQLPLIPKLKNGDNELAVLLIGSVQDGRACLCDAVVPSAETLPDAAEELFSRLPPHTTKCFLSHGVAFDLPERSVEACGHPLPLTRAEFHVLRCIALARTPVSAMLISELCFGAQNAKAVMTQVSSINRKLRSVLGQSLILSGKTGGYRMR